MSLRFICDSSIERAERLELISISGDWATTSMLDVSDASKPVMFGLEDPIGMIERFGTARNWQGLEARQWHNSLFYNCHRALHGFRAIADAIRFANEIICEIDQLWPNR